jgi:hypothetical protein
LRAPTRSRGRLRNGTEDNFNLDLVRVVITQLDDLVKSFLLDVRLGLIKSLVVTLDHRTPYRPLPQAVTLDTFLEWNIKKEDYAGNMKLLCQLEVFLAMGWSERCGIHHTEPVQAQAQFRQIANKTERLGLKTLIPLVVTHAATRPIRRDDLRGAKVALRKSCFAAGGGSAKQNDRRADQSHPLVLALICCLFLGHSSPCGSFLNQNACPY